MAIEVLTQGASAATKTVHLATSMTSQSLDERALNEQALKGQTLTTQSLSGALPGALSGALPGALPEASSGALPEEPLTHHDLSQAEPRPDRLGQDTLSQERLSEQGLNEGLRDHRFSHLSRVEIEMLLRESQRRIAHLEELSVTDEMLGILNRRGFTSYFRRELATARRDEKAAGLMLMIDLDNFKAVNDAYGHLAGDAVLKAAAQAIQSNVRSCDVVGRLGGDEFGVLLTRAERSRHDRVARIGISLNSAIAKWRETSIPISASIGVASFFGGQSVEEVMGVADRELYVEKRARKMAQCG